MLQWAVRRHQTMWQWIVGGFIYYWGSPWHYITNTFFRARTIGCNVTNRFPEAHSLYMRGGDCSRAKRKFSKTQTTDPTDCHVSVCSDTAWMMDWLSSYFRLLRQLIHLPLDLAVLRPHHVPSARRWAQESAGAAKVSASRTQSLHHSHSLHHSGGCCSAACWSLTRLQWDTITCAQLLTFTSTLESCWARRRVNISSSFSADTFTLLWQRGERQWASALRWVSLCLWAKLAALQEVAAPASMESCKLYDINPHPHPPCLRYITPHTQQQQFLPCCSLLSFHCITCRLRGELLYAPCTMNLTAAGQYAALLSLTKYKLYVTKFQFLCGNRNGFIW